MPHDGHERVQLTAHERRQFELIEQTLASEALGQPSDPRVRLSSRRMLWWALVLIAGWTVAFGVLLGTTPLIVLGTACTAAAVVLRRHRHADG